MTNYVEASIIMFCTLIYHHQERQFYLFFMLLDDIEKDKGLQFFFSIMILLEIQQTY